MSPVTTSNFYIPQVNVPGSIHVAGRSNIRIAATARAQPHMPVWRKSTKRLERGRFIWPQAENGGRVY
jgi:hypothetical protein